MAKRLHCTAVICFTLAASDVGGFVIKRQSSRCLPRRHVTQRHGNRSRTTRLYLDGMDLLEVDSMPFMMPNIISTASDPVFEAEILNDISHIVLDFTTFVSPNTVWIRLFNVIGRILIISSDYVQDQHITPDEAFFQASMLIISTHMFLKSAYPRIKAASSNTSLSVRDRRAFTQLFSEVDLSVLQFKTLLTSQTLEWIELEHNQSVSINGDCMYWLHSGDISSTLHDQSTSTKYFGTLQLCDRLFGDVLLAKTLEETMFKDTPCKKKTKSRRTKSNDNTTSMHETLVAGPNGATLLRMSTSKLLKAMNHDDQLSDSINRLILFCMQEKLSQTFTRDSWKKSHDVIQDVSLDDVQRAMP